MCSETMILSDLFVIVGSWSLSDLVYPSGGVYLKDCDLSLGVPASVCVTASVYACRCVCDDKCVCAGYAACTISVWPIMTLGVT